MIYQVTNIQAIPPTGVHAGGSIGGVAPKVYTLDENFPNRATFLISGTTAAGKNADVEWYWTETIPAGAKGCCMSFDLYVDKDYAVNSQAQESDIKFYSGGWGFNGSMQIDNAAGGTLQIGSGSAGWQNTGFTPGILSTGKHHIQIFYSFDYSKKVGSILAVVIDDVLYLIPANLQNQPMTDDKWTDGAYVQIQGDLTAAGGQYEFQIDNLNLTWV